ncbi:hypothetical protein DFH07DRAFT_937962 [Mycena maculata]|uniref:Uncharacterized protein n=1 Tax=Mycena maculata TaxID=230809 RepID=A0AAD7NQS8_9AGAR|nr:hypothetical protein DFH07DRAFT_937962 [Mycena maculata]
MPVRGTAEAELVRAAHKELAYLEQFGQPLLPFQREEGRLSVPGAVAVGPPREPEPLSLHRVVTRPLRQGPGPVISASAILTSGGAISSFRPDRLATRLDPAPVSPCREFRRLRRNRVKASGGTLPSPPRPLPLHQEHGGVQQAPSHGLDGGRGRALIVAAENWELFTGGGVAHPLVFDAEDVRETMKLDEVQTSSDEIMKNCRNIIGFGSEGSTHYEEAMSRCKHTGKTESNAFGYTFSYGERITFGVAEIGAERSCFGSSRNSSQKVLFRLEPKVQLKVTLSEQPKISSHWQQLAAANCGSAAAAQQP